MITHEEDVAAYATRVVRLRDGVIIGDHQQIPIHARDEHVAHVQAATARHDIREMPS